MMFQGLRWRLLLSYLTVMAAILGAFGIGVYLFFSRNLYQQLDKKLLTLAQSAAPSFAEVRDDGNNYLDRVNAVPWRDIFNRDKQSLEWFNAEGDFLGSKGSIQLKRRPKIGSTNLWDRETEVLVRVYTISVFKDSTVPNEPILEGYIRASQSVEEIEAVQHQLLFVLVLGGGVTLLLSGLGGMWLTQKAIEPIEASFQKLKQFTADASHELRNPLTGIKASIELMQNHPERIHEKDRRKVNAIANATSRMSQLIEDLLFLARTDRTVTIVPREKIEISLKNLLADLIALNEPFAQQKQIEIKSNLVADVKVMGDRLQLTRLFSNLLHNALQYTPEGGTVSIDINKQNRSAIISVKDTGIGIPKEQLPHIFDRFWRADKARNRREGGTGLGLAIAFAIAQNHGGKIFVTSKTDEGSCFSVKIPIMLKVPVAIQH